jgi:hypothetical protein
MATSDPQLLELAVAFSDLGLARDGPGPKEAQARTPATVCAIETSYSATFAIV